MVEVERGWSQGPEGWKGSVHWGNLKVIIRESQEHQSDRDDLAEDSYRHQGKYWALDHPDLQSPPKFKFKILSTFTQLSY